MSEFVRGAMRLHILHHAEMAPIQSAWMAAELARHGHELSPDALPSMLFGMHADDLLTPELQVVDGGARRVYALTRRGRAVLEEECAALAALAREVIGPEAGR
jgi:DNA-binding PadR family transcriptional regulator